MDAGVSHVLSAASCHGCMQAARAPHGIDAALLDGDRVRPLRSAAASCPPPPPLRSPSHEIDAAAHACRQADSAVRFWRHLCAPEEITQLLVWATREWATSKACSREHSAGVACMHAAPSQPPNIPAARSIQILSSRPEGSINGEDKTTRHHYPARPQRCLYCTIA